MLHRNAIIVCLSVAILLGIGIVMLTSTSVWIETDATRYSHLKKQSLWMLLGLFGAWWLASIDYRIIRKKRWIIYSVFGVSTLLLAILYIPGVGHTVNGATRWLKIPGIGTFQPSELGKLATVIAVAAWYAHYQSETRKLLKGFLFPSAILGLSTILIFFEKDMGTAASLGAAGLCMIFIAGVRMRYIIPSMIVAIYGFWHFVQMDENRSNRIMAFLDLETHKLGYGHQQWRGLLAFGNGGFGGAGIGNGAEKHGYLPFAHTDFIFPMIGEELGWVTFIVVLCFVGYTVFGFMIAMRASDVFGRLLAIGLTAIIVVPAMVNIGVTTAMLPNTGLPLPFVSYGGSNLVLTLASVGLLISIHKGRKVDKTSDLLTVKGNLIDTRI